MILPGANRNAVSGTEEYFTRTLKKKTYELTDHLGNVRSVITDMKLPSGSAFLPDATTRNYYYPFGMERPGMTATTGAEYRFGYNGKKKMDEIYGKGNALDFGARILDTRVGRFLSLDPKQAKYPGLSPYHFTANNPISFVDKDGKDFGVEIEENDLGGTIIIKQNVYAVNQKSYDQMVAASKEITSLSGSVLVQTTVENDEINTTTKSFTIKFEVHVIPPTDNAKDLAIEDPFGNYFEQGMIADLTDGKATLGETTKGFMMRANSMLVGNRIYNGGKYPQLMSHEMLHTMGLKDADKDARGNSLKDVETDQYSPDGRMRYTATVDNGFKMLPISGNDVKKILQYAFDYGETMTQYNQQYDKDKRSASTARAIISHTKNGKLLDGDNLFITRIIQGDVTIKKTTTNTTGKSDEKK